MNEYTDVVNLTLDDVNVTVLFESDGSPFVVINIKVCMMLVNLCILQCVMTLLVVHAAPTNHL